MAHNKRMGIRAGRLLGLRSSDDLDSDPVMILVSDDSKGSGGGRYSPLWEQALSCDQSPRRDIPSPYLLSLQHAALGEAVRRGPSGEATPRLHRSRSPASTNRSTGRLASVG